MKLGLLWFDANPKLSPQRRLDDAAARYAERFGRVANCCHVHPKQEFAPSERPEQAAIVVVPDPAVQPNHLWVGFDEAFAPAPARTRRSAGRGRTNGQEPNAVGVIARAPAPGILAPIAGPRRETPATDASVGADAERPRVERARAARSPAELPEAGARADVIPMTDVSATTDVGMATGTSRSRRRPPERIVGTPTVPRSVARAVSVAKALTAPKKPSADTSRRPEPGASGGRPVSSPTRPAVQTKREADPDQARTPTSQAVPASSVVPKVRRASAAPGTPPRPAPAAPTTSPAPTTLPVPLPSSSGRRKRA